MMSFRIVTGANSVVAVKSIECARRGRYSELDVKAHVLWGNEPFCAMANIFEILCLDSNPLWAFMFMFLCITCNLFFIHEFGVLYSGNFFPPGKFWTILCFYFLTKSLPDFHFCAHPQLAMLNSRAVLTLSTLVLSVLQTGVWNKLPEKYADRALNCWLPRI